MMKKQFRLTKRTPDEVQPPPPRDDPDFLRGAGLRISRDPIDLSGINDPDAWADEVQHNAEVLSTALADANRRVSKIWLEVVTHTVAVVQDIRRDPAKRAAFERRCKQQRVDPNEESPNDDYARAIRLFAGDGVGKSSRHRYANIARYLNEALKLDVAKVSPYLKEHGLNKTVAAAAIEFGTNAKKSPGKGKSDQRGGAERAKDPSDQQHVHEEGSDEYPDGPAAAQGPRADRRPVAASVTAAEQKRPAGHACPQPAAHDTPPTRRFQQVTIVDQTPGEDWKRRYAGGRLYEREDGTVDLIGLRPHRYRPQAAPRIGHKKPKVSLVRRVWAQVVE